MSAKGRILVVDDDPGVRTVFSIKLMSAGYSVATAATGQDAIEKSASNKYDLALVDFRLPDMNGTELLESLARNAPNMRKVVVTGVPDLPLSSMIDAKRADAYLAKPVGLDTLLTTVEEQLSKQRDQD